MEPIILDNIPFQPTQEAIQIVLDTKLGKKSAEAFQKLIKESQEIAKPKAIYKVAYLNEKGDDYIKTEGHTFKSRILRLKLGDIHRVFVYVATCGRELEDWMNAKEEILDQYYASVVNEMALDAARDHLIAHIEGQYDLKKTASMAPGSLEDWPIQEQRP
ncbi:MAG: vitamin B12 dependent methionine synthase, partial [Chloroflexota bacterium]|nr:vitamin B12 dependent methionine synthase [Chloroflexota bacterium]